MKRIVLFNAPPRAGKDTAANVLLSHLDVGEKIKFSDPVKRGTHGAYGLWHAGVDFFEDRKDQPCDEFLGITPRQAYINFSEKLMKPVHGPDVFGKLFVRTVGTSSSKVILVPDSGFYHEAVPAIEAYGADNILLVQIFMEGRNFDNDSRDYIKLPEVKTVHIWNRWGELDEFEKTICKVVGRWIIDGEVL